MQFFPLPCWGLGPQSPFGYAYFSESLSRLNTFWGADGPPLEMTKALKGGWRGIRLSNRLGGHQSLSPVWNVLCGNLAIDSILKLNLGLSSA